MEANQDNVHRPDCMGGGFQELDKRTENPAAIDSVILESDISESSSNGEGGGVAKPNAASASGVCSSCEYKTPPPFLLKTYEMVENIETNSIVSWNSTGTSFIIWDPNLLSANLLNQYFRHNNFQSFVCQLNTYGFKKINWDQWEFKNEYFQRGRRHLLKYIKRRNQYPRIMRRSARTEPAMNSSPTENTEKELQILMNDHDELNQGIQKLKEHQKTLEKEFASLKNLALGNAEKNQKMAMFMARTILSKASAENPPLLIETGSNETPAYSAGESVAPLVSTNGKNTVEGTSDKNSIQERDTAGNLMASFLEPDSENFNWMEKLGELASDGAPEEQMADYQLNTLISVEDLIGTSHDWAEYLREM